MPALTLARIEELAARGESEFLELKQSTAQLREAAQTICGMLNRPQPNGRYVLFGVAPDGTPVGQQVGERTIEQVAAEIREIRPQVSPRVDRVPVADGREVIAVAVPAADKPPYTYKHRPYRRVGNTTSVMPEAEYQRILIERAHQEDARWENQPAEGWSIDELVQPGSAISSSWRGSAGGWTPLTTTLRGCCGDWACTRTECCRNRPSCCSEKPSRSQRGCRSACCALRDFEALGAPPIRSFWTTGSFGEMLSSCSNMRNDFYLRMFPSQAKSAKTTCNVWMSLSTR